MATPTPPARPYRLLTLQLVFATIVITRCRLTLPAESIPIGTLTYIDTSLLPASAGAFPCALREHIEEGDTHGN